MNQSAFLPAESIVGDTTALLNSDGGTSVQLKYRKKYRGYYRICIVLYVVML